MGKIKRYEKSKLHKQIDQMIDEFKIKRIHLSKSDFEKFCKEAFLEKHGHMAFYRKAEIWSHTP